MFNLYYFTEYATINYVKEHLMNTDSQRPYPVVIIVRGLPGSGKSYLAKELQKSIETPVVMLDPDATDYDSPEYKEHVRQQEAEGVDPKLHAYRFLRAQAYAGIAARKVVVWNQPFTNLEIFNKMTARLHDQAKEHNTHLQILVVEVEIDPDTAKERIKARKQAGGHGPSDETFARFTRDYKSFAKDGYTTVTADGADSPAHSVSLVMQALQDLQSKISTVREEQ